jgi:hypothetical protein
MSAQGGTLGRLGTVHVPMWPVAVLLAATIAAAIALSVSTRGEIQLTGVSDAAIWNAQADAYVDSLEAAAVLPVTEAAIWNAQADAYVASLVAAAGGLVTHAVGLENPGAYGISQITEATYPRGLENPGSYPVDETFTPKAGGHRPIEVNGEICGQCR